MNGVVVSNVFADANRGGAAITSATVAWAEGVAPGEPVTAVLVEPGSPASSLPFTLAAHPSLRVVGPPAWPTGRAGGVRAVLATLWWLALPRRAQAPALASVRDARLVIGKGGWVFVQRRGSGGLLSLWLTTFPLVYARRIGVPGTTSPTSVGPFARRSSRWLAGFVLRGLALVVVRDQRSAARALDAGVERSRLVATVDSVFGLPTPDAAERDRVLGAVLPGEGSFAALTVRYLRGEEPSRAVDALARLGRALLDEGLVDRLAVVLQVEGDRAASVALVDALGAERATLVDAALSAPDLAALYGSARILVGCRLHSAILALVGGTPAVAVSIDGDKTEGVFESVGLPLAWVVRPSELSRLASTVRGVLADAGARGEVVAAVAAARAGLASLPAEYAAVARKAAP